MNNLNPIPANELQRILDLSDFNLDYSNFNDQFNDLAKLAASVAGTEISLVNLIDSYTQWTISSHGLDVDQMPREESVCQYTISKDKHFEIVNLNEDERFKNKFYVTNHLQLRYYYGIPLKSNGHNLGALCVMDRSPKILDPEKAELLEIIADEIINRLNTFKIIDSLRNQVREATDTKNKVVHDIRGPIGGIIGLAQIISEQGKENKMDEVLQFINLIYKSGKSILELADEILSSEKKQPKIKIKGDELNLMILKEKLEKLYLPQATAKGVSFTVSISPATADIPFSKNKLLQIIGNLISNAIKFTPMHGKVGASLALITGARSTLKIIISDTGAGLTQAQIDDILTGTSASTKGTNGEPGYGFGLALVKHLINGLGGILNIKSDKEGAKFIVELPQPLGMV
ncbi:GAF domain-containing sensor histidine kinase [Daejeonella lutea]|uniref:histidine kinase n=1 Tax=Daejeonella lutea TaxID=572036 RepID=A0A1T5AYT4_9SPHI|nr:GAF domain-containing sensor histidine kinase [Daejeonella lutea]SKB39920.1 GAF domain-containing protein [Daejeonella lutea]